MVAMRSSPPQTPTENSEKGLASPSIRSILRLHPQERLIVKPLHWTARHVDSLGCNFIHNTSLASSWRLPPPLAPDGKLDPGTIIANAPTSANADASSPTVVPQRQPLSPIDRLSSVNTLELVCSLRRKASRYVACAVHAPIPRTWLTPG
ncbi:uncharacterized protein GLRG_11681 [Colletotrichum graminicola M1.001]|uniref:Uncharacterized protein n=1 Tax=Colletotrichum graminicola (strain M1.001 / M2 / FGSC 10212) TaxID=645133 RepID=E3R0A8_COLGM|nr:uncharacterized protein GLRG_11681 [Colletotrichum graminicola M1.001]EFQ36546.1 hypothetical protein GLRG_11681 [Colletotrichum graminicola M1.001]